MKTRQLQILEELLSYGIRILIGGLKLRFVSHLSNLDSKNHSILTLIDKINAELKEIPEKLFENSKLIDGVLYESVENYEFEKPCQLFGAVHNILEDSFVLTLRYAAIYEALQVLPADYPINKKLDLENSLKVIETGSIEISKILEKLHESYLTKSVHDSIVILKAKENYISIDEADKNERKRWE